jgi:DUF1680 family protein
MKKTIMPNQTSTISRRWPAALRPAVLLAVAALAFEAAAAPVVPLPEKVPPVVPDAQDFQNPDRVHLSGWINTRMEANEGNRLVKIDPARLLEGYRKRPGRQTWDGEHVGKWLHAATLAWVYTGDPALREKIDYTAAELAKCQEEDGYLGTYTTDQRWTQWDVWAHKYNLIGLITYMRYTGNTAPLATCRRMADLLCNTFGDQPGKRDIIPAGQHKGLAPTSVLEPMVLLYRFTGDERYLDFCKYIVRSWEQPNGPKIVSTLLNEKRVVNVGDGKAYEMLSCLNGALEYYRTTGNKEMFQACLIAWDDIVKSRLYITGTASYREFFHEDYDLPNVNNVGETCVTVTWLQFNAQLLRLTGEARFAEQLERVVLNQLFGAQCPDGSGWGYYVQMQGKKPYSATLDGHCCLSSGPRGVALIPTFALSTDAQGLVVNLYERGTANLTLRDGANVGVVTETKYPVAGKITMTLNPDKARKFTLKLRIPEWSPKAAVQVNGKKAKAAIGPDGYLAVNREWQKGDQVEAQFQVEPRVIVGDHRNEGRLAFMYGPLVLAADEALLPTEGCPLSAIGVRGSKISALNFTPEPATAKFKTWPEAEVFRVDGVAEKTAGNTKAGDSLKIGLVPFADAGGTGTPYRIWLPYKTPSPKRNLLVDGVEIRSRKPNAGAILDDNFQTIAQTYNARRAPQDWFGVELEEPVTIERVIFAHGKAFHDGGWFDASAGKPQIEMKTSAGGSWVTLAAVANYPATTATDPAGLKPGEKFECKLPQPVEVYALRVVGKPASGDNSKQAFASCAELQAFGPLR